MLSRTKDKPLSPCNTMDKVATAVLELGLEGDMEMVRCKIVQLLVTQKSSHVRHLKIGIT